MALVLYSSTSGTGSGVSSKTVTADMGSGSNRCCIVLVSETWQTVTGITCGGVAMEEIGHRLDGGYGVYAFQLVSPGTGTQDIVVSLSWNTSVAVTVLVFTGVDQTTPVTDYWTAAGSGTPASRGISSSTDNIVVAGVTWDDGSGSAGAGEMSVTDLESPVHAGVSYRAGDSYRTMSWTLTSGNYAWSMIVLDINWDGVSEIVEALAGAVSVASACGSIVFNPHRRIVATVAAASVGGANVLKITRRMSAAISSLVGGARGLRVTRRLMGAVAAANGGSRAIWVRHRLTGAVASIAAGSRAIWVRRSLLGSVSASATGTRALRAFRALAGGAASAITIAGGLGSKMAVAATTAMTSTLNTAIGVRRRIAGTIADASVLSASAAVRKVLASSIASAAAFATSLGRRVRWTGSVIASSTIEGVISRTLLLVGGVNAFSVHTATLYTSLKVILEGLVRAVSRTSVAVRAYRLLASTAHAIAAVRGSLSYVKYGRGEVNGRVVSSVQLGIAAENRTELASARVISLSGHGRMTKLWR